MPRPRSRTSEAIGWASLETLLRQGLQFLSGIFLARILSPADFGLVAMLAIFTAIANRLVDSGFGAALIQQREEHPEDASTAFWFNMLSGTLMALLLGACAPMIAAYYGHPDLVALTWAFALNVWLSSWLAVHTALLTRHLNFRVQAKASGVANLAGAFLAIALAVRGAGPWALVGQSLVTTLLNVGLIWWLHPWRPTATFSMHSLRRLRRFGGYMLLSSVVDAFGTRLYSLLIGRLYSSDSLGLYSRAVTTRDASQTMLGTIFSRVAFPVLARHGADPDALRSRLKTANQLTMSVNLPTMIGLAAVADVAVPTLFGRPWMGTVPILQILCLTGALWPLQISNLQVLMAQGHSSKNFRLEIIKKSILVLAMLCASHWGMLAIAWATVGSGLVGFALNAYYSRRFLDYGPLKQLRDLAPYLGLTAAMALAVLLSGHVLAWLSPGKRLLAEIAVGLVVYVGASALLRLPGLGYAFEVLRSMRRRSDERT